MSLEGWPTGWGMDGGLGVGLGSFFVGFRGRVFAFAAFKWKSFEPVLSS